MKERGTGAFGSIRGTTVEERGMEVFRSRRIVVEKSGSMRFGPIGGTVVEERGI